MVQTVFLILEDPNLEIKMKRTLSSSFSMIMSLNGKIWNLTKRSNNKANVNEQNRGKLPSFWPKQDNFYFFDPLNFSGEHYLVFAALLALQLNKRVHFLDVQSIGLVAHKLIGSHFWVESASERHFIMVNPPLLIRPVSSDINVSWSFCAPSPTKLQPIT